MQEESVKILRKVRRVVGPSSLLGARGMPTLEATWIMVLTLLAQTGELAEPTVKESSR